MIVAVFQWGWLRDLVGLQGTVPIETFFPLMLFAILFGLSMDYEVFLVSRIREEHLEDSERPIAGIRRPLFSSSPKSSERGAFPSGGPRSV